MAAPLLETPSRVLRRVMEAEDVELPSLPSIVDHFDQTSDDGMYSRDDSCAFAQPPAKVSRTPVSRLRETRAATPLSDITSSSINNSGPLFPPRSTATSSPPSSYAPSILKPSTSTPVTARDGWTRRSQGSPSPMSEGSAHPEDSQQTFEEDHAPLASEEQTTSTARTAVYVPDEMSLSFDGLPISDDHSSVAHPEPAVHGSGNGQNTEEDIQAEAERSSPDSADTPPERRISNVLLTRPHRRPPSSKYDGISANVDLLHPYPRTPSAADRIPSLSRSSDDESSAAAHTPENPAQARFPSPIMERDTDSPVETSHEELSQHSDVVDFDYSVTKTPRRSISSRPRGSPTQLVSFTPASQATPGAETEPGTPRPGVSDAQWRKQHVLAVLQSTARKPARGPSAPPTISRIRALQGDATPLAQNGRFAAFLTPGQGRDNNSFDSAGESSFVSIASSADLTSDRRATTFTHGAAHRGNNSVPNILLPTGLSSSSAPEHRVDGAKLQKHLNAMNKQLVEENRELAAALEQWQEQARRQRLRLLQLGDDGDDSMQLPLLNDSVNSGKAVQIDQTDLLQELAAKLEMLEEALSAKDDELRAFSQALEQGGSPEELQALRDKVETLTRQVEEQRLDFAAKTEQHAGDFRRICEDYESTIVTLKQSRLDPRQSDSGGSSPRVDETLLARLTEDLDDQRAQVKKFKEQAAQAQAARVTADNAEAGARQEAAEQAQLLQAVRVDMARQAAQTQDAFDRVDEAKALERVAAERLQTCLEDLSRVKAIERDQEEQIVNLEAALDEAEHQIAADERELQQLRAMSPRSLDNSRASSSSEGVSVMQQDEMLRTELDSAHREVGRLQQRLADREEQCQELQSRLEKETAALRSDNAALQSRQNAPAAFSPFGPLHHSVAALRTPGPLREMSWMNTTVGDAGESALRAHIGSLQAELATANKQLDGNFSRLEAAGASAVNLADRLAAAERRVGDLESQLASSRGESGTEKQKYYPGDSPVANRLAELQVDMKQERERLQQESIRLRTTISMLQDEHEHTVRSLKAEKAAATTLTESRAIELQKSQTALKKLADEFKRQGERYKSSEQTLRSELSAINRAFSSSERQLQSLRSETQSKASTSQGERQNLEHLMRQLSAATRSLRESQQAEQRLLREKDLLLRNLSSFERDLKEYRIAASRLHADLEGLQAQRTPTPGGHLTKADDMRALSGQIRYLKAKFTREASFRNALCLQKRYLLLLVGGMSLNEQATLAAIASMGFPAPAPAPRKRSLRSVVLACIAISRARNAAARWTIQKSAKENALAMRQHMRVDSAK